MTLYDSSVLIDFLDGVRDAREYVEDHLDERAVSLPLVVFEVYQGEVFKMEPADFDAVDDALSWLKVVDETASLARATAELQNELHDRGSPLAARDATIAGTARGLDETLAVSDSDFAVDGIDELVDVDFLSEPNR